VDLGRRKADSPATEVSPEDLAKARRAKRVIYVVMAFFILLPLFLAAYQWFSS